MILGRLLPGWLGLGAMEEELEWREEAALDLEKGWGRLLLAARRLLRALTPEVCLGTAGLMEGVALLWRLGGDVLWFSGKGAVEDSRLDSTTLGRKTSTPVRRDCVTWDGVTVADGTKRFSDVWVGWILGIRMFLVAVE